MFILIFSCFFQNSYNLIINKLQKLINYYKKLGKITKKAGKNKNYIEIKKSNLKKVKSKKIRNVIFCERIHNLYCYQNLF